MSDRYLLVEKNAELAAYQATAWEPRGMMMERADSMLEGIKRLEADVYLFVGINDDNVDFMPMLSTMRGITDTPIFIGTRRFTTQAEVDALGNGANLYARWHKTPADNMASVLAHLSNISVRKKPPISVFVHSDILLSPQQHCVYVENAKIEMTRLEFDLLRYFIENHDIVVSYSQIYERVWGAEYDEAALDVIKSAVKRVRGKISGGDKNRNLIESIRGVGFKFPSTN